MKYIVLHREGTEWYNRVGNSLHVPFIDAATPVEAVEKANGLTHDMAFMYLVLSTDGWVIVQPQQKWKVDPF